MITNITVSYKAPTTNRGSEIKLKNMRNNTVVTLSYDYSTNMIDQALKYFEDRNWTILGYSANYNETYTILIED